MVTVPRSVELIVSATTASVFGKVASSSESLEVSTLPVSTTCGPVPAVASTASVLPMTPPYASGWAVGASFTSMSLSSRVMSVGARLSSMTVMTNCSSNDSAGTPLSVTRRQIVYELASSYSRSEVARSSVGTPRLNTALPGYGPPRQPSLTSENRCVSMTFWSVAVRRPTSASAPACSWIDVDESWMSDGGSLATSTTVTTNTASLHIAGDPSSDPRTQIEYVLLVSKSNELLARRTLPIRPTLKASLSGNDP